ncbi:MAG: DUF1080 domain-containing protein [Verrucomicrobiales bacterium]|nr:DUF1080 domain-containing protein [Verrucomicrobiales bacterium]
MKIIFIFSLAVVICGLVPTYAEDGLESIFDGKTLDGWNCRPSSQSKNWSVEKGQIIGRGKGQESYLMFNDQLGDFELRFSYKLISDEGNTGVEVRSHPVKGRASRLHGYHADIGHIGIGDKVLGAWDFHENNRGDYLAKRGHRVTINENGKKEIEEIDGAFEPSDAKEGDWNKVVVYAKGNRLWFTINGKIASEVIDNEEAKRLDKGYIGFQLHGGDKMVVAFKDISVKR